VWPLTDGNRNLTSDLFTQPTTRLYTLRRVPTRMRLHPFGGERFRIVTALIGVDYTGDRGVTVIIPADAIIEVVSGPRLDNTRMVDVLCEGRPLSMFIQDILGRFQGVSESAGDSSSPAASFGP
jgi:hypothetical protein